MRAKRMKRERKKCEFIQTIQNPTNELIKNEINANNDKVVEFYKNLLNILKNILIKRKTKLLPIQATIFTTNYDLFIEKAFESLPFSSLRLNDGFGRFPSLTNKFKFSPENFFEITSSAGFLYDYKVDIPAINLIKLHGSMSWERQGEEIIYCVDPTEDLFFYSTQKEYLDQFAVVLPQKHKFQETVIDRFYYDLLRTYANQLDEKNTVLIVFGFSFEDAHIYDITKRALKNPTLKVIIFAYDEVAVDGFKEKFENYNNVDIIRPSDSEVIDFQVFNSILATASGS